MHIVEQLSGRRTGPRPLATVAAVLAMITTLSFGRSAVAAKPLDPVVLNAIERGSQFLARAAATADGGRAGMGALGLLKSGTSPDDPAIEKIIQDKLLPKFQENGTYQAAAPVDLYYEAGVDLMVFANAHPEKHDKEIRILAKLLLEAQHAEGYWTYPVHLRNGDQGDTSITQYALLGLWEADRIGLSVPSSVWDKAASWLAATQDTEGAFWYHPGVKGYPPTLSVVAAGTSNLLVCRHLLYNTSEPGVSRKRTKDQPLGGVLKKINLDAPLTGEIKGVLSLDGKHRHGPTGGKTSRATMDRGAQHGLEWLDRNWVGAGATRYQYYFYYALERACTLAAVDRIGDHDWYDEISDGVLKQQRGDGSWSGADVSGAVPDTAFALLFLSRATARIMKHRPDEKLFGGGLMIGGRGLPTNLGAIQGSLDGIKIRKLDAPVDQLLSELENPQSANVEAVQEAIVESVELGDREKLVGQKNRLIRLTRDPRLEVRRTAIWALGRCATIYDVRNIVKALDDPELGVVIEANNALCWFNRRPNGFGRPIDPLADLPENASERQKQDAAKSWRLKVRSDWRTWFESVRPYSERNLPIDLP